MRLAVWCIAAVTLVVLHVEPASAQAPEPSQCEVTLPNGVAARGQAPTPHAHGTEALAVLLSPDGTVTFRPGGPGGVEPDGALTMKFPWHRGVRGHLAISGRRLDRSERAVRSLVASGYGEIGFQSTLIAFPSAGCWEVTGRVADTALTFVLEVVKIGSGPAPWRRVP